eukprot:6179214-Pleurochrysis_carterae.AAC.1
MDALAGNKCLCFRAGHKCNSCYHKECDMSYCCSRPALVTPLRPASILSIGCSQNCRVDSAKHTPCHFNS